MKHFTFTVLTVLISISLNATECDNLALTSETYSETENLIAAIQGEFGNEYTIGDWSDLQAISDIDDWITCMGLAEDQTFMLTRDGEYFYNGNRQYYVQYSSDGVPYPGFLVHDQIGDLYLGSWYGIEMNILAKNGNANLDEFITEFHDLNDNLVPEGWELFVHNPPVDLEGGKLLATPTDARGCLMRSGTVPPNTTKMTFEWDGNLAYTYWGMTNQLQLDFNQNEWFYISIITAKYNFGSDNNHVRIRYHDGNQATDVFNINIPIELNEFHYKVEVWGNNLKLTSTIKSSGELYYEETFDIVSLIPSFSLESINKVRFWAYTTTDNDNWLDNISIELDGTTDISTTESEIPIKLYPNPAMNWLNIDYDKKEEMTFSIYNIQGQEILKFINLSSQTLDISNLKQGIYLVKFSSNDGRVRGIKKFVKE